MSVRPDLTATWLYRGSGAELRFLLLRRAAGHFLPGMWQCVTGSLEPEERIVEGALREVYEETAFAASDLEALYDLDMVNSFHEPSYDAILLEVTFAARLRPGREPTLSAEHDACRWAPLDEARELMVWPAYREALGRIADDLADPARARWWELSLGPDHQRLAG
jgi:dihydroneopterin triphosphate diphosphatase